MSDMMPDPMTTPTVAQKGSYPTELEAGKDYYWCACGLSAKQPFCDGSHKTTAMKPMKFSVEESRTAGLCGCKQSAKAPFCNGSHKTLP